MHEQVGRREQLVVVAAGETRQRPELREQDRHADAAHEADHHGVGDEADEPSGPEQAEDEHDGAGEDGQREEAVHAPVGRQGGERAAGGETERGRGHHRHAPRAGGERSGRRAGGDDVQPVHRRNAGQHRVRHRVPDLGGPYRETRGQVVQQPAIRAGRRIPGLCVGPLQDLRDLRPGEPLRQHPALREILLTHLRPGDRRDPGPVGHLVEIHVTILVGEVGELTCQDRLHPDLVGVVLGHRLGVVRSVERHAV